MKKQFSLILIIFLIVFVSCNPENKEWKAANEINTVESYSNFIDKYPEHEHQEELKTALTDLINSGKEEVYVLYDNFRLRDKPILNGELIQKMSINSEVEILEKSNTTDEIEIAGYHANSYWYKIKIKEETGWTFGAGLGCSSEIYDACNLYLEQFSDETLEDFEHCETIFWLNKTIADNNLESFEFHILNFPQGIYKDDADEIILFLNINELILGKWIFTDFKEKNNFYKTKQEQEKFHENMKSFLMPYTFEFFDDNTYDQIIGGSSFPGTWKIDIETKTLITTADFHETNYIIDKFDKENLHLIFNSETNSLTYFFEKQ